MGGRTWRRGGTWGWDVLPPGSSWKRRGGGSHGCRSQEPAQEGSPLPPLGPGPMEVDGAKQAPGDGDAVGEAADSEATDSSLAHGSQP